MAANLARLFRPRVTERLLAPGRSLLGLPTRGLFAPRARAARAAPPPQRRARARQVPKEQYAL